MSSNNNTPRLRFPEFTGEWVEMKIGDIADVLQGFGFPNRYQGHKTGELPFCKVGDISSAVDKGERIITKATNYVDYSLLSTLHAKPIPVGSTIFAKIGEAIRSNKRIKTGVPCLIDNNAAAVKAKNDDVDDFLFYLMSQINLADYAGGIVPSVNKSTIEDITNFIPQTSDEQQKIAECLSALDSLITAQGQKVEALKEKKKGLMQQLFPQPSETIPRLRFPGFEGEWEEKKLGEVFDPLTNSTLSRADLNYKSGKVLYVHYGDVLIKFGEVLDLTKESLPFITNDTLAEKACRSSLKNGDIIIADTAEDEAVGKCTEIRNISDIPVVSGLHTIPLRPFTKFADGFMGYYLNSSSYRKGLYPLMQGVKVSSISKTSILDTILTIPTSYLEQQRIASCLTALDELIAAEKAQLAALKDHKKGLMQQLFPQSSK